MVTATPKDTGKLKAIWEKFSNRLYREAFAEARLRESVAAQVFFIRESRKLTQGELADLAGTQQPAISRIERGEAALTAKSLEAIARALDVALSIRFVPYSEVAEELVCDRIESHVPSYSDDTPAILVSGATQTPVPRIRYYPWTNGDTYHPTVSASSNAVSAKVAVNAT